MVFGNAMRIGLVWLGLLGLVGYASGAATGLNVNRVVYTHAGGTGEFYADGAGFWTERNPDSSFRFEERRRDQNAVHLYDPGRDVWIMLDLSQRVIRYRSGDGPYSTIYAIDASEPKGTVAAPQPPSPAKPPAQSKSAWTVVGVSYELPWGGTLSYTQNADASWTKRSPEGTVTYFEEARNESYVQLHHPGRAEWVRLNVQRGMIQFGDAADGQYSNVYGITDVQHQVAARTEAQKPVLPPRASEPQPVQNVQVLIRNSNRVQMGVYIDDPQAGLVHDVELPFQTSYMQYYPVGTILVFGPQGGAAVQVYTVNSNPEQQVEIEGEQQEAIAQSQPQAPPQIQTTQATISGDGSSHATQVAGIGAVDESNLAMQFRTRIVTLRRDLPDGSENHPIVLDFNPQVYAWYENGSTFIRVDTYSSRLRIENYRATQFDQGPFIEKIEIQARYPQHLQLTDYFPQNNMNSTQVSSSRSLSIGGNAGPHPYSVGVSAMLSTSNSASANVPDFRSETSHYAGAVNTNWALCGIPGQDDRGRTHCVYNEPLDLGYKDDGRWISGLSELPPMARNFSSMRQSFVLSAPGLLSSTEEVGFTFGVDLRIVHLAKRTHEVLKPGAEIGTALACIDPQSATCKRMKKGDGVYHLTSREASTNFDVRLRIDLAPLANSIRTLGL